MKSLNQRIDALRSTRVALRKALEQAWREADPGYRAQKVQTATLALRSTEDDWQAMQVELEARGTRIDLAQLRHQGSRPVVAPVRRAAVPTGYICKVMRPGR